MSVIRNHRPKYVLAALAGAVTLGGPAWAEGADGDGSVGSLAEITVTAQKVNTKLQKTPIAITALSPDQMADSNIRSIQDLDKQIPGMTVTNAGPYPLNVTIRGVGYDGVQNNSAQPGVAFVENGVYIASPVALTASFLDLDQLEVLRGPQGTVNGQNADGGAMNVTTSAPVLGKFKGSAEGSYGSYNYNRERGMVNVPVGERFAIRAAFQHDAHDGWYNAPNQPAAGGNVGSQNSYTGRINALWKPTDRLSVNIWAEIFNNDSNGLAIRNMYDNTSDIRTTSNDYATPQTVRSRIVAGTVAYDLGYVTLKSITSFQYVYMQAANSGDMVNRALALSLYGYKDEEPVKLTQNHSVTEELNISHSGGLVDWIAGAFFLHTWGMERYFETQQSSAQRIDYNVNFFPSAAEQTALYAAGLAFESNSNSRRTSVAGYGQATLHLASNFRITGGIRYSWDKYSADTSTFYIVPVPLSSEFKKVTGKVSVEYDLARTTTVYASFSTGVKPGGTNLNPSATVVPRSFSHEFVRAYEIGAKNEFFNRTLRLNVSGFYNDYRNLQADSEDPIPYQGGMTNVPKSHVWGVEGEAAVKLPQGFRIDANATGMWSKVDSDFQVIDPYTAQIINRDAGGPFLGNDLALRAQAFTNIKGNQLGRVPHFSSSASISKTTDIRDVGKLDFFIQANYRSAFWYRVFNNPLVDRVSHQFLMNLNARFQPQHGPWYVELNVSNLLGSNAIDARYAENFGVGGVFESVVPPRQVIGRIGVNF
ncbi:TonB-dependent receptor [Novosphingobium nitrogenifigens]|uniref:TonB-dependent receptor n=1 Tax=Novosphingobium nitrogenifigens TaxID=378548 RepID=UPI000B0C8196|nr:TonB-dependent receptor [Novosphingobium nitrogenifigens]